MKIKHAMILAAGFGNRMKPITSKIPKPLIRNWKKKSFRKMFKSFGKSRCKRNCINVHYYKGDKIKIYLKKNIKLK